MSAIVVINEGVCLGKGRGQFSVGVALVIKRFHRESDILVDPQFYFESLVNDPALSRKSR